MKTLFEKDLIKTFKLKNTSTSVLDYFNDNSLNLTLLDRECFVKKYSFAILTGAIIKALKDYGPMLEIGCGSGYWSYELAKAGVDIIATDKSPLSSNTQAILREGGTPWLDFEILDASHAVQKYPDRTVLTVWPAGYATKALEVSASNTWIIVGEGPGGCTEAPFHLPRDGGAWFSPRYDFWNLIKTIKIPQWSGIHDYISIYQRKK